MALAQHSKASVEWYTPEEYVVAARKVLGRIDLDPASCVVANQCVGAAKIYTAEDDGLVQPWSGRVFLNPPGGIVREFWNRLVEHYAARTVPSALWVGFSLEQLQSLQRNVTANPLEFPTCFPRKRVRFSRPGHVVKQPTHGNFFTLLPESRQQVDRFAEAFGEFGHVTRGGWV